MRRITSVLVALALLVASLPATLAVAGTPAGLIINPGFEEEMSLPGALPPWWYRRASGATTITRDSTVAHSGRSSAKIAASAAPDDAMLLQTVAVEPDTLYRLSAWVKTEDVAHSAGLIDAGANVSVYGTYTRSGGLFGSNDWTRQILLFNSRDAASVRLGLRLGSWCGATRGTAWFDDVELTPLAALWPADGPHPSWKILVLIYRTTSFSYTDERGMSHRLAGSLSDDELDRAARSAALFVTEDIPALTSGNMVPELTIRYPERALTLSPDLLAGGTEQRWWAPSPRDIGPERDGAFDSVIVIWQDDLTDQATGEPRSVGRWAGLSWAGCTGQTFTTICSDRLGGPSRDIYCHEWGHSILWFYEAMGITPLPTVCPDAACDAYVHCPTGEPYIWVGETPESPIPNSICNVQSGFTHDYYSGTIATAGQPARCLGVTPRAWAFGGPVTNILCQPPDEGPPGQAELAAPRAHRPSDIIRRLRELSRGTGAALNDGAPPGVAGPSADRRRRGRRAAAVISPRAAPAP